MHRRMEVNGKATKLHTPNGNETNWISPNTGKYINKLATNRHVLNRLEANRLPKYKLATNRHAI